MSDRLIDILNNLDKSCRIKIPVPLSRSSYTTINEATLNITQMTGDEVIKMTMDYVYGNLIKNRELLCKRIPDESKQHEQYGKYVSKLNDLLCMTNECLINFDSYDDQYKQRLINTIELHNRLFERIKYKNTK